MTGESSLAASVIVPTFGDWDELQDCLDCLEHQDLPAGQVEIIVANNNPDKAIPQTLSLAKNVRIVWQGKPGSYAARNAAVAESCGNTLFFTDADCRPESDWISAGIQKLEDDASAGRLGGAIELTSAGNGWSTPELYDRLFNLRQERYVARGYAATANLVVRREVFDLTGPFDETLLSSGDKEWNRRAGRAGASIVYADNVRVRHAARSTYEEHARKRSRVAQGRFTMKSSQRLTRARSFKYLLPSIRSLLRIACTPQLRLPQRLALAAFDYRLRRLEFHTTQALCRGGNVAFRQSLFSVEDLDPAAARATCQSLPSQSEKPPVKDRIVRFLFKRCMKDKNLRKLVRRFWPEMTTMIDGQIFHLHPADNTTERLMYMTGRFGEAESLEFLKAAIRNKRCLLFDIGANCGAYTLPLASIVAEGSSVHAFEPSPVMAPRLIKNLEANALQGRVQLHQVALSSADGQATLHVHPRNHGQSSLRQLDKESHGITVEKHQLARYVPDPLDTELFVIKIDVEGREDDVLFNYLDTAGSDRLPDIILMEIVMEDQWTQGLKALFERRGYTIVFEGDGNAAFQRNVG